MAKPPAGARETEIRMVKRDGAEVLRGTASVAGAEGPTALERRLAEGLPPLQDPVILADVKIGMKTARQRVRMDFDQNMGALYPFSLRRKLAVITEPSWLYDPETARESRWGRALVPFEMLSVLFTVTLTVAENLGGKRRDVVVTLLKSDLSLREKAWIDHNRETVDRLSGGRIAYIYLSDMNLLGMQQFIRQFYGQLDKQALIRLIAISNG